MIIKGLKKLEDGAYDINFTASDKEMEYLTAFAINNLIMLGIIKVSEDEDGEQEVDFLSNVELDDTYMN